MYDTNFENRLLAIRDNPLISNLDEHIKFVADRIRQNESSAKKIISVIYELSKEDKGIKLGDTVEYHVLKHKEDNRVTIFFTNPIEQRFFDLSVYEEKFKGVIIQNKDSKELIYVDIYDRVRNDNISTNLTISRKFMKGIVTPTNYYHSHRGINDYCFGNITDGLLDSMKFSFTQTMNNLIEGLRSINFDDTIANSIQETNELCFFGNHFRESMDNLNLRNTIDRKIGRNHATKLAEISFYQNLKDVSDVLHSYHKECYCYYCTCIHLIEMDRSRISTDELSRIVVDKKSFEKILNIPDNEKEVILKRIDEIKNKDFVASYIELDTELNDGDDSVSNYIDDNLSDLLDSLAERYDNEISECNDLSKQIDELQGDTNKLYELWKNKQRILDNKPTISRVSTIDFLLGDSQDRNQDGVEQTEYTAKDYEIAKEEINIIRSNIRDTDSKLEELRSNYENSNGHSLHMWIDGDYSDSDVYESHSDEVYEMASDWLEDRESDTDMCNFGNSYRNDFSNYDSLKDMIISTLPSRYDEYEHLIIKSNGLITPKLWRDKMQDDNSLAIDNLGELYIKQHGGVDMNKIRTSISTFVGCGTLGSNIAYTMSRLGYRVFSLIDYDSVTLHNLPNQFFKHHQQSFYKVRALRDNLLEVLPQSTLPLIFTFENRFEDYREYNGDIPTLLNNHTDVFFLVTDNLESRYNVVRWIKELTNETAINYLVIDCRMNDLNTYVTYAYYINDIVCYNNHLRTILDKDGELIQLEDENVCGLQSSILVAQRCSLSVIDILNKHHKNESIPFLTTNEFD